MTAPDHLVPTKTYTASDIYQSQSVDPAVLAAANNADMQDQGEDVRLLFKSNVADPLANNVIAVADVITDVEAAANAAAAAQETADIAYGLSSYWEAEALVASSGVVQGVNELVIGLCQNVPDDTDRFITDLHIALKSQPGGFTLNMVRVDLNGLNPTVVHTAVLGANVTRINYNALNIEVFDKERVHWEIPPGGIVGSVAPTVLQCLIFGVILAEP